jgi:hypothetical protein
VCGGQPAPPPDRGVLDGEVKRRTGSSCSVSVRLVDGRKGVWSWRSVPGILFAVVGANGVSEPCSLAAVRAVQTTRRSGGGSSEAHRADERPAQWSLARVDHLLLA